jgi:hypothetical protein
MTVFLRQSTAVDLAIGPFLDASDGVTIEDGLTLSQADVRLKKNNGNWAQINDNTSATHEEFGWYEKEFDATDTNTVGRLVVSVTEAGALPVWHEFWVLEEAIFDALFAASATGALPVSAGGIVAATFAADVDAEILSYIVDDATRIDASDLNTEIDALKDGGRLDLLVDGIKAQTDGLPSDPADASVIAARFDTLDTSVADLPTNAELATALGTADDAVLTAINDLPTNAELATALGTADDAVLAQVALVKAKTDLIPADPADASDIAALIDALPTSAENAAALLDFANGVETGLTPKQALRLMAAALLGKASGLATTTAVYRDVGDSKDRITATVDADGNRSAVTLDAT